jgi:aspartyl-tRNA synthetase
MLRTHTCNELNEKDIGKTVRLCGWVDTVREHGKIIFVDLRDRYGKIQTIVIAKNKDAFEILKGLTKESSIMIEGKVQQRPKGTENDRIPTGRIEVFVDNVKVFNKCPALPFEFEDKNVNEDVRLKHRFIDLRRYEMQMNLMLRHRIIKAFRDFFDKEGFLEIETPILAKSTPEGARDYLVPSRIQPGKFYALPQSPQIFKQLLMVSGCDKYFQIARCLRDEDLRADRQPEFTQLDAEMSFVEEEDVYSAVEKSLKYAMKDALDIDVKIPFQRMTYDESMKKYRSDKPDLRKKEDELAFVWITDFPVFEYSEDEKRIVSAHNPFAMPKDDRKMESEPLKIKARTYDLVLNGIEILSGSIRNHNPAVQRRIFKILGLDEEEVEDKFGFMLNALSYGAPQHGGFAIGLDRLIQILIKAPSIREVIAFPKNKEAKDVMLNAPSELTEKQLKDLHISVEKEKKPKKKK